MSHKRNVQIDSIITKTMASKEQTSWAEIMEAVSAEMKIKNWMEVRGILQFQITEGEIKRTDCIKTEAYIKA